jgi:curved DNA binding protein
MDVDTAADPANLPATDKGISAPDVVDKYKAAADIVSAALELVRKFSYAGMSVAKLCQLGDAKVEKGAAGVYNKARTATGDKLEKGVAFPTCVCRNHCAAHFSPLSDADGGTLAAGDIVTVQLGAHIDGYCAMLAATDVVRASKDDPVSDAAGTTAVAAEGRAGDAMVAAWTAAQAVLRVMRPGRKNSDVTEVIAKVARDFGVEPLEGVLSHEMKRYVVDGSRVIMNRRDTEGGTHVEEWSFEENEVYGMDIAMSTGEGKAKSSDAKTTVYKRQVDVDYKLKLKASRAVFSEVNKRFPTMPFTLRALEDPTRARLGMTEMISHGLVVPYPVLHEREGQTVARVAMTVLVLPSQTMPITALARPPARSEREVKDPDVLALLATSIEKKKKKSAGSGPGSGAAGAGAAPGGVVTK